MKKQIKEFESMFLKEDVVDFKPGDTIEVSFRVREGEKERIQIFRGVVLQVKGTGMGSTVTVRKMSGNVAVERIFPIHSPMVSDIKLLRKGLVRRAKLYYLRELQGKAARIKEKKDHTKKVTAKA